jgi:hypothetical protein
MVGGREAVPFSGGAPAPCTTDQLPCATGSKERLDLLILLVWN